MPPPSFIAPSSPLDRRQLGKYEVLCRLSTGGMSAIYLAHQKGMAGFKKLVVLKTILPDIGGEEDFVGMFLEEARITAVFNHPHIAQVYELDTDDGQLFMAMEFVQGCTLVEMARACRAARESIPVGLTLTAVRDTALALHYAHTFTDARGRRQIVIHRDVAEKNIMVTYEGVTKLLDFGIAKALGRAGGRTSVGMVKGTSGYMSPEQIRGEPLDPRSDIFALGVVLHECLTGLRLFHGKTAEEGMMAALREAVQPPSKWNPQVGPELDAVVLKALERDREKRFGTALEFARAIEKAAPGALWHPEEIGEVVTRHFSERRAETRRLLEAATDDAELTGNIKIPSVIRQVRASAALPDNKPPVEAPRIAPLTAAPARLVEPTPEVTRPEARPLPQPREDTATTPQRPRAMKPDKGTEKVAPYAGGPPVPDDDDIEARTLPDRPRTPRQSAPPPPVAPPSPARSVTSETLSITNKAPDPRFDYDDDGQTAIASPEELGRAKTSEPARRKPATARVPPVPRPMPPAESLVDLPAVAQEPRRTGLFVLLGVLFVAVVAGLLVLFDVIHLR